MYGSKASLLLDTDVFINFLRGMNEEAAFFKRVLVEGEFIGCYSSITEIELFAVEKLDSTQESDLNLLLNQLQRIEISSPVARQAGRFLGQFRKSNGLEMPDAIIAASAIVHKASLVSKNVKHFSFIPGLVLSTPGIYIT